MCVKKWINRGKENATVRLGENKKEIYFASIRKEHQQVFKKHEGNHRGFN